MAEYLQDYITVAVFAGFGALLVAAAVGVGWLLRRERRAKPSMDIDR